MPKRSPVLIILACVAALGLSTLAAVPVSAQDGRRLALEAAKAHLQGKLDEALGLFGEALRDTKLSNDRRAIILNDRGVLLARLNRPKEAIDDFNDAAQLYPEYAAIYNNRGSTLLTIGLAQEAMRDFDRAILLAPGYVAAYNNRASAHIALQQGEAALVDYTKALELTPTAVAALNGRGRVHLAADRPQTALRDFSRAVEIDQRSALGYRNRAQAKLLADEEKEAIEDLSRAIAFEPANPAIYVERGRAYMAGDDLPAAVKDFSKALELAPDNVDALEARALAYVLIDAQPEAEADVQRALAVSPKSATAIAARALLYLRTGQADLASKEIARAQKLDAKDAEVLWIKGEIDEASGRRDAAVQSYRAALAGRPSLRPAVIGLNRLGAERDPGQGVDLAGLGIEDWRVERQGRRLIAVYEKNPRLHVPLESFGDSPPRLLTWELQPQPYSRFGLLRFSAGRVAGLNGEEEVENVAVIDHRSAKVLGVVPDKRGAKRAKWSWSDTQLSVAGVDGLTDEFTLRIARPRTDEYASRYGRDRSGYAFQDWNPWQGIAPPSGPRRARRSKPKTIFDLIFGN
ncbi:MAG: tetratricopeptide repeat protein [Hyphomicrobiaceae bacterium]